MCREGRKEHAQKREQSKETEENRGNRRKRGKEEEKVGAQGIQVNYGSCE